MILRMLPQKNIYIDSRDRTPDSKSASNFKIELPYTVRMPENTVFFVTDVCIPHVWKTIEADFNDKLYMIYAYPLPSSPTTSRAQPAVVILDEGNYTLTQMATYPKKKRGTVVTGCEVYNEEHGRTRANGQQG